jgi:hypothetical protein
VNSYNSTTIVGMHEKTNFLLNFLSEIKELSHEMDELSVRRDIGLNTNRGWLNNVSGGF